MTGWVLTNAIPALRPLTATPTSSRRRRTRRLRRAWGRSPISDRHGRWRSSPPTSTATPSDPFRQTTLFCTIRLCPPRSHARYPTGSVWDANEAGLSDAQIKVKRKGQFDFIMRYYRDTLGWPAGPHLFIDERWIWLFSPMAVVGVHAAAGNSYRDNARALHYSIGIEVIGYYESVVWPEAVARNVAGAVAALQRAAAARSPISTSRGPAASPRIGTTINRIVQARRLHRRITCRFSKPRVAPAYRATCDSPAPSLRRDRRAPTIAAAGKRRQYLARTRATLIEVAT